MTASVESVTTSVLERAEAWINEELGVYSLVRVILFVVMVPVYCGA